jgi:acetyltransferase-like isoleucine patch superfamily enzyme
LFGKNIIKQRLYTRASASNTFVNPSKRFFFFLKASWKKLIFHKRAVVGNYFQCAYMASCVNENPKTAIRIGDHCELCCGLYACRGGEIQIGSYTTIRAESFIASAASISIGDFVIISNHVTIRDNNSHPTDPKIRKEMCLSGFDGDAWSNSKADKKPIRILDNVWIGERSVILKGVTIGTGSVIACDSVVVHDVPEYTVVAGNPATIVKKLPH